MRNIRQLILICLTGFAIQLTSAQSGIVPSGGDGSGTKGSVSYSVGQQAYRNFSSVSGSVAEGVQHPYEISIISATEDALFTCGISVFPNPSTDVLILNFTDLPDGQISYSLYDLTGKICRNENVVEAATSIDMRELAASVYFLAIYMNERVAMTFKINKIKQQ